MRKKGEPSPLEKQMGLILDSLGVSYIAEYVFAKPRKWRFDFAIPNKKLAIECEGGVFSGGRHTRGLGFIQDCEKYNAAVILGWKVLRYTTNNMGQVVDDLEEINKHMIS